MLDSMGINAGKLIEMFGNVQRKYLDYVQKQMLRLELLEMRSGGGAEVVKKCSKSWCEHGGGRGLS